MAEAYAGKGMLEDPQLERLGALLAQRGDWREARRWLELADKKAPPVASAGRLLLLEVLIQSNEVDRIGERAQAWMTAWRSGFLSGRLILRVAQSGLYELASRLALKYTDIKPDDTFEMIGLLAGKGPARISRVISWSPGPTAPLEPTGAQLRAFVQASALAWRLQRTIEHAVAGCRCGSDPATQGRLAEELASSFGRPALVAIRPLLSNEALLTRPLFAAELSLFEGNREMARWYLGPNRPNTAFVRAVVELACAASSGADGSRHVRSAHDTVERRPPAGGIAAPLGR